MEVSLDREFSDEDSPDNGLRSVANGGAWSNAITSGSRAGPVIMIHRRALDRECLARSLQEHNPALAVTAVGSLDELRASRDRAEPSAILLVLGERKASDPVTREQLDELVSEFGEVRRPACRS